MKNFFTVLGCIFALQCLVKGADINLPVFESADIAVVDTEVSDGPLFQYALVVTDDSGGALYRYYSVGITLRATQFGRPLRATSSRIVFDHGETISSGNPDHFNPGGSTSLPFHAFDESLPGPGLDWIYYDKTKGNANLLANGRTEILIGFRFLGLEAVHYGWMRFTRPDTHFLTFFELSAWDWNPLPGEPIAAGLPPAIPLTPVVTPEGLRLTWPAAVWDWILESSASLGPDAVWEPVPEAYGPEVVVLLPEATRFFRVRRP